MKNKKAFLLVGLLCSGIVFINARSQSVSAATVTSVNSSSKAVNNVDNQSDDLNSSSTTTSGQKDIQKQEQPNQENKDVKTPTSHPQSKNISNQWVTRQGHNYYLINNKPVKGLRNINKSWYLFDKQGRMLTGVRKIPKKLSYGYFAQDGKRRFNNTNSGKSFYWINKSGSIVGIKNNAKVICQRPQMPTGCEITAVTMMINFAGKKVTKDQAAKVMPRSYDPNKGFIGSPYREFPLGFWVAPNGVKPVVSHYLGTATNMTNCSLNAIKRKLIRSHLVVAWVGWFDGFSNHAITLTGYHGNTLYYNDPWTGTRRSMSIATFKHHWAMDGHRALSY